MIKNKKNHALYLILLLIVRCQSFEPPMKLLNIETTTIKVTRTDGLTCPQNHGLKTFFRTIRLNLIYYSLSLLE